MSSKTVKTNKSPKKCSNIAGGKNGVISWIKMSGKSHLTNRKVPPIWWELPEFVATTGGWICFVKQKVDKRGVRSKTENLMCT